MLVVRVKRKRDEAPVESLFVVDTPFEEFSQKKARIQNVGSELDNPKQLLLKRVRTLDTSTDGKSLDNATSRALQERSEITDSYEKSDVIGEESMIPNSRKRKLIVAPEKKRLLVEGMGETCIVVDMLQVVSQNKSQEQVHVSSSSKASTKILDPATRELERGIVTAVAKGDFNDISAAIIKGANASYQISIDSKSNAAGYTSMMAAAMWSNLRMVKRLAGLTVDVTLKNRDDCTAYDLIGQKRAKHVDNNEIRAMIQSLLLKQVQVKRPQQQHAKYEEFQFNNTNMQGDEFVVDVYTTNGSLPMSDQEHSSMSSSAAGNVDYVHIDGLKIMDDGQVELVAYDSDWSDLAEDEDPDSNDERHYANDYPEESEEEAWFQENQRNEDEKEGDYDLDEQEDEFLTKQGLRTQQGAQSIHPTTKSIHYASIEDDLEELNEDGNALFDQRHRIGKVLHPHIVGENDEMDTATLQKLWGEEQIQTSEHENVAHIERVDHMRERTNMVFASNPREFTSQGLPKYARDLSDDEDDHRYMHGVNGSTMKKDEYNDYAYDSEYDEDEDDADA